MKLRRFLHGPPRLHPDALFLAPSADITGDVTVGPRASVWFQCVVRGDINSIVIGEGTNVQDGSVIHVADDFPAIIGRNCTIGHRAIIHACTIGDEVLVGMGAIVMDGAEIGARSLVAAGALVPKGLVVPPGSLVMGFPAKIIRPLTIGEQGEGLRLALKYQALATEHARSGLPEKGRPFQDFLDKE